MVIVGRTRGALRATSRRIFGMGLEWMCHCFGVFGEAVFSQFNSKPEERSLAEDGQSSVTSLSRIRCFPAKKVLHGVGLQSTPTSSHRIPGRRSKTSLPWADFRCPSQGK